MGVCRHRETGKAVLIAAIHLANSTVYGVIKLGIEISAHLEMKILCVSVIGHLLIYCICNEEPTALTVIAHLIDIIRRQGVVGESYLKLARVGKGIEDGMLFKGQLFAFLIKLLQLLAFNHVHIFRRLAYEDQPATRRSEIAQALKGSAAHCDHGRHNDGIIAHLTHLQGSGSGLGLLGEKRLADIVEVYLTVEHPFDKLLEILAVSLADIPRGLASAPIEPIALDGVYHRHRAVGLSACQGGMYACKMVFYIIILLVPRGLVVDGCRIVSLGISLHRHPGKMRDTDTYTESRLPVALEFVVTEVKIPVCNAVHLGNYCFLAVLSRYRLCLLGGGQFYLISEQVDADETEMLVISHYLAHRPGLHIEGVLAHKVTRQLDAVFLAPTSAECHKSVAHSLTNVIVVAISGKGGLILGEIPEDLGQSGYNIVAVRFLIAPRQVIRPRRSESLGERVEEHINKGVLGLVGKHRRDGLVKLVAHPIFVCLVSDLNEFLGRLFGERVNVGISVIPIGTRLTGAEKVPLNSLCARPSAYLAVGLHKSVLVKDYIEGSDIIGLALLECLLGRQLARKVNRRLHSLGKLVISLYLLDRLGVNYDYMSLSVFRLFRNETARKARGPLVLVVKPGKHPLRLRLIGAGANQSHKLIGQIFIVHTEARVHMESAKAHLLEIFYLSLKKRRSHFAIPRPEGRAAVFACGASEKLIGKLFFYILFVKHRFPPLSFFLI